MHLLKRPWESRSAYSTAEVTRIIDGSMANANRGFSIATVTNSRVMLSRFISVLAVLVVAQPLAATTCWRLFYAQSRYSCSCTFHVVHENKV